MATAAAPETISFVTKLYALAMEIPEACCRIQSLVADIFGYVSVDEDIAC